MRFALAPTSSLTLTLAPEGAARGEGAGGPVMELVTFRLAAGTNDPDFLKAARATAALVTAQPGFGSRNLLRDESGEWTDMIHWQSLETAQKAAAVVMADPGFGAFASMIDMQTVSMRHVPVLWQMAD